MSVLIRGYAAVFNQLGLIADFVGEKILCGAFDGMLARGSNVSLLWAEHDESFSPALAKTDEESMFLFADRTGLAFQAELSTDRPSDWSIVRSIASGGMNFASIYFTKVTTAGHTRAGFKTMLVSQAEIDHVTITNSPVYKGTGVWLANSSLDGAPARIQDLAANWARGYAAECHSIAERRRLRAAKRKSSIDDYDKARRAENVWAQMYPQRGPLFRWVTGRRRGAGGAGA